MAKSIFFNKKRRLPKFMQLYVLWLMAFFVFILVVVLEGILDIPQPPVETVSPFVAKLPVDFSKNIIEVKLASILLLKQKVKQKKANSKQLLVLKNSPFKDLGKKLLFHYGHQIQVGLIQDLVDISQPAVVFDFQRLPTAPLLSTNLQGDGVVKTLYERADISYVFSSGILQIFTSALSTHKTALWLGVQGLSPYEVKKLVHVFTQGIQPQKTSLWLNTQKALKPWVGKALVIFLLLLIWIPFINQLILKQEKPDFISGLFSNLYLSLLPVGSLVLYHRLPWSGTAMLVAEFLWVLLYFVLFLKIGEKKLNIKASAISLLFVMNVWLVLLSFVNQAYLFLFFYIPLMVSWLSKFKAMARFLILLLLLAPIFYILYQNFSLPEVLWALTGSEQWFLAFFAGALFALLLGRHKTA